ARRGQDNGPPDVRSVSADRGPMAPLGAAELSSLFVQINHKDKSRRKAELCLKGAGLSIRLPLITPKKRIESETCTGGDTCQEQLWRVLQVGDNFLKNISAPIPPFSSVPYTVPPLPAIPAPRHPAR